MMGNFKIDELLFKNFNLRNLYMFRCPPALYDPYTAPYKLGFRVHNLSFFNLKS
jgi:hypothetical protein